MVNPMTQTEMAAIKMLALGDSEAAFASNVILRLMDNIEELEQRLWNIRQEAYAVIDTHSAPERAISEIYKIATQE